MMEYKNLSEFICFIHTINNYRLFKIKLTVNNSTLVNEVYSNQQFKQKKKFKC